MAIMVPYGKHALVVPRRQSMSRRQVVTTSKRPQLVTSYRGNDAGSKVVLLEEAPQVRTILWSDGKTTRIALPYVCWLVYLSESKFFDMSMYHRRSAIPRWRPWTCRIDAPAMPNLWGDRTVCLGNKSAFLDALSGSTPEENSRHAIEQFWRMRHNHDLDEWLRKSSSLDARLRNLGEWEKATSARPGFVLDIPWNRSGSWRASQARKDLIG